MTALRDSIPVRSAVAQKADYRRYKCDLRKDFAGRCGYCDAMDEWFGGRRGAHIDHFAPKSKFPTLETQYDNLVYSCPICNGAKSDTWVGNNASIPNNGSQGFVDPCRAEFDKHLARRWTGEIVPLTKLGEYMADQLKLRLIRHKLIWQAQMLNKMSIQLKELRPRVQKENPLYQELLEATVDVLEAHQKYRQRIYAE